MPANLSMKKDGQAEMMYVGARPWHGLGTELQDPATSTEAITAAGMDWEVIKDGTKTATEGIIIPNSYSIIRMDNKLPLGTVGNRYTPMQNTEAFDFFDSVVGDKAAIYHTAGCLDEGRRVWILAKLNENMIIAGRDEIEKFVLLTMAHDGTGAIQMMNTPVRVVCQNTLNVAVMGAKNKISIRHTKSVRDKLTQAKKALGITLENYKKFEEISGFLVTFQVNGKIFTTFLDKMFPIKSGDSKVTKKHAEESRQRVTELYEDDKKNNLPGIGKTMWTAFNSVAEYVDHYKSIKKDSVEKRTNSIWFGSSAYMKEQAWNTSLQLAGIK